MSHEPVSGKPAGSDRSRTARRMVIGLVLGVLALLTVGLVFELVAAATSARRYLPPGELYVVDGVSLHLHCIGEGTRTMEVGLTLSRFGVMRLLGDVFGTMDTLPEGVPEAMVATTMSPRHMRAHLDEVRHLPELDVRVAASGDLGARPLTVLAAGHVADDALDAEVWGELQEDLGTLAASAEVIVVPDADHLSIVTDERHAQIVSDAIRDVVRLIRDERTGSADEPG